MNGHLAARLSAYLDGELPSRERSEVESHLRGCEDCARRLEEMAAADAAVRDLPTPAPAGYFETLPSRVRARLESRALRAGWRAPIWYGAAAAALLLAVLVPLTMRPERPVIPEDGAPALDTLSSDRPAEPKAAPEAAAAAPVPAASRPPLSERAGALSPLPPPKARAAEPSVRQRAQKAETESAEMAAGLAASPSFEGPTPELAPPAAADVPSAPEALGVAGGRVAPQAGPILAEPKKARPDARPRASRAERPRADEDAAEGTEEAYRQLVLSPPPRSVSEARALREAWRAYARTHSEGSRADEARVRVVESGLAAYRLGRVAEDLARARDDAAAYLRRPDAAQADRVRSLLASLER